MSPSPEGSVETGIDFGLRPTTPEAIVDYFGHHFDSRARVKFPPRGDVITIPDGWHGAGKEGEVAVYVGDLLTFPIAGTKLSAEDLLRWSTQGGFSLTDGQHRHISASDATELIEGTHYATDGNPILRLTRVESNKTPVEIQFFGGATNPWIEKLSKIGNTDQKLLTESDKNEYRQAVRELFRQFISKGTKGDRTRMGISPTVDNLRRVDDCSARGVTIIGDQTLDDAMRISLENLLEIHDVSVATLQSVVLAITMADRRHVPLIMRIGAPAFGLGSGDHLNYIMNTLPQMEALGPFTVGDMGTLMDEGESAEATPKLLEVRKGDASRELRLFLGGGLPVEHMLMEIHEERRKPFVWDLAIRRAARVDNGPNEWGVLISGSNVTVRTSRRDKTFLEPGTYLTDHEDMPWYVLKSGQWVSFGFEEGGLIPATFVDSGKTITLYKVAEAKK
jgi:hypothetical protein